MVVGIDTYHDSASKGRSVCGFISSTNASLTRYFSQTAFHHTGQEMANNITTCMTGALRKFVEVNKTLPERIIVYRDGVGDGQLGVVVEHEIPQFLSAFKSANADFNPKFAMVVVKKRINTRLFSHSRGQYINPLPGTVVDTEVTKPEW
jgi:aubergine-like protein